MPPSGTRSSTAVTAAMPDANDVADAALQRADGRLEHLPGRVAVAAVADVAARVVGRRHHERRVQRPVRHRRGGRPAETAIVAGARRRLVAGGHADE